MKKILLLTLLVTSPCFAADFKIQSASWQDGQTMKSDYVFNGFGCAGNNVSPQVSWAGAPEGTKSFAVTVYDPDAPTGSGWWHWTVFNIPAEVTQLKEGAGSDPAKLPAKTVQGRTDFGKTGYGGACPPPGDKPHRYVLTVYALKTDSLSLDENAPGAMVGFYLNQNMLAKDSLTVFYSR